MFELREVDMDKFLTMPRCKGEWQYGNSGCLFTALLYSMDYVWKMSGNGIRLGLIDSLSGELVLSIGEKQAGYTLSCQVASVIDKFMEEPDFTWHTISLYDGENEEKAFDEIMRLINKLPKKVSGSIRTLQEVV